MPILYRLQRGPDHVVGDRRHREWPDNSPSGFNGAPTTWSGIEGAFGVVPFPVTKLQRGPDHVVRGSSRSRARTCFRRVASTGPRPRGRGSPAGRSSGSGRYGLQRGPDHVVGDRLSTRAKRSSSRCFNGAPTTWSGIGAVPVTPTLALLRFNGAPTTWSGIGERKCSLALRSGSLQHGSDSRSFNGAPTTWSGIGERPGPEQRR